MKRQDITALHDLSLAELRALLEKTQREVALEKVKAKAGKSKGGSVARVADDLARIHTIIKEKESIAWNS